MTPDYKPIPQAGTQTPETDAAFDQSEVVRRHTAYRGTNVTTRWRDVALELYKKCTAEQEQHRMEMAAVMTASIQNTESSIKDRITRENAYWTQAYDDVCKTVDREMDLRAQRDRLETERNELRQQLAEAQRKLIGQDEQLKALLKTDCGFGGYIDELQKSELGARAQLAAATQEAEQAKRELTEANHRLEAAAALCGKFRSDRDHAESQLTEAQSQLKDAQEEIKYRGEMVDSWRKSYEQRLDQLSLAQTREKKLLELRDAVLAFEQISDTEYGHGPRHDDEKNYSAEFIRLLRALHATTPAALANATPSGAEPTEAQQ